MRDTDSARSLWRSFNSAGGLSLLWSLVVALGGLVLLVFVVGNGFLPELDLTGAISLLASASLVSLFLVFSVAMLTFAGGWTLYSWFGEWGAKERGQISGLLALLSASAVYALVTVPGKAPPLIQCVAIGVALVMLVVGGVVATHIFCRSSDWARGTRGMKFGMVAAPLFVGALFAVSHAMVFSQLYRAGPDREDVTQWAMLGVWLIIQAACIGVVAASRTPAALFKISGSIGAVGIVLLLLVSNNPTFIVQRVVQLLGIGSLPNVSLAVTQEGCQVLNVLSAGNLCTPSPDKSVYIVEPVTLRSRFGKQVLIEYAGARGESDNAEQVVYEAVLETTEVLGWQRTNILSNATTPATPPNM